MRARYHGLQAIAQEQGGGIQVRFDLENRSGQEWHARHGHHIGWQVYDPETSTFITEGEWAPLEVQLAPGARQAVQTILTLPPQDGPYRIYVSPLHEQRGWFYTTGTPFVVIDAVVSGGLADITRARVATLGRLRRESLLRSIPKLFRQPVESLWRNRRLIESMARRDVLARYRGSFGDVFWTILNPLLLMGTYFFVFGIVLKTPMGGEASRTGFALYLLAGMLPWLAFSEPVGRSPQVVLEHRNFVKKLVFPLDALPVVQVVSALITELFAMLVYIVGLAILRHSIPSTLLWLPALIVPQALFTLGLCWFLAGLGAYARDLGQIIGFMLTLWFFLTPICYSEGPLLAAVPALSKNPLFILVRGYRSVFLESHAPDLSSLWKFWVLAVVVFLLGHAWFYKLRRSFADII
jgi:lipopolysaccharide transport system permease protein